MPNLKGAIYHFTTHLDAVADYLFQAENINHPAVTPLEQPGSRIQIQDNETRSYVCIQYADRELKRVRAIQFCLNNETSIIDRWIEHLVEELGAKTVRIPDRQK